MRHRPKINSPIKFLAYSRVSDVKETRLSFWAPLMTKTMKDKTIQELLRELGIDSVDTTEDHIGESTLVFFARPPARRPKTDERPESREKEEREINEN